MALDTPEDLQKRQPLKIWERLPQETDKSWAAFQIYREMPTFGAKAEKRSLGNLARKLGYTDAQQVTKWSGVYDWQARCRAYDAHVGTEIMTIREVALAEYQQAVVSSLGLQLAVLDEIINQALKDMKEQDTPDPLDVKRLVSAIHEKDDLARRAGSMPTAFIRAEAEIPVDEHLFIIGGDT